MGVSKLTTSSLVDKSTLYISLHKFAQKGLAFLSKRKEKFYGFSRKKRYYRYLLY